MKKPGFSTYQKKQTHKQRNPHIRKTNFTKPGEQQNHFKKDKQNKNEWGATEDSTANKTKLPW